MEQLNETGIAIALLCGFALVAWLLGFWAGMYRAGWWKAVAKTARASADAYLERDIERGEKLKVRVKMDKRNRWRWRVESKSSGRTLANSAAGHKNRSEAKAEADMVIGLLGAVLLNSGPAK